MFLKRCQDGLVVQQLSKINAEIMSTAKRSSIHPSIYPSIYLIGQLACPQEISQGDDCRCLDAALLSVLS